MNAHSANLDDIRAFKEAGDEIRKTTERAAKKYAQKMVNRRLGKCPPSVYEVGDEILVRIQGREQRKTGKKVKAPKAVKGVITKAMKEKYRYRVKYIFDDADNEAWFSVGDITSVTRDEEAKRRASQKIPKKKSTSFVERYLNSARSFSSVEAMMEFIEIEQTVERSKQEHESVNSLHERFFGVITSNGYQVRNQIPGDGNCMFAALVDQLHRVGVDDFDTEGLRLNIVEYLRRHPTLSNGTELFSFVSDASSWEDYLRTMNIDGTWGDHLVLRAASEMLQMDITVISSVSDRPVTIRPSIDGHNDQRTRLLLGHIFELHYTSLEELQHSETFPILAANGNHSHVENVSRNPSEGFRDCIENEMPNPDFLQSPTVSLGKPHEGPDDLADTLPLNDDGWLMTDDEIREAVRFERGEDLTEFDAVPEDHWLFGMTSVSMLWARDLMNRNGTVLKKVKGHFVVNDKLMDDFDAFQAKLTTEDYRKRHNNEILRVWLARFRPSVSFREDGNFVLLNATSARDFDEWKFSFLM